MQTSSTSGIIRRWGSHVFLVAVNSFLSPQTASMIPAGPLLLKGKTLQVL